MAEIIDVDFNLFSDNIERVKNSNKFIERVEVNELAFYENECKITYTVKTLDVNTLDVIKKEHFSRTEENSDEVIKRILETKEWLEQFMTDIRYAVE